MPYTHSGSLISTGNEELDSRLGGGIPHPSLALIEGENGTAKTTLALQLVYGGLKSGLARIVYFTTESTAAALLRQAKNITLNLTPYYVKGALLVYPIYRRSTVLDRSTIRSAFERLIAFLREPASYDMVVVDSLTTFLVHSGEDYATEFMRAARLSVARGATVLITLHTETVEAKVAQQLRAVADVYYKIGLASVGGKRVRVLQVVKARGVPEAVEGTVAFDVDPAFGIKIVPIVVAQS